MIKALRITSIAVVVLGCGLLIFMFIFANRSNPKIDEFLKAPGTAEKFSKTKAAQDSKTKTQVSPLVKQAQDFALYLNPPKPEPTPLEIQAAAHPVIVTPKFTLVGTSIFPNRPEMSMALIDEPGKGLHWVKQSSQIGHLTIKEIKDGIVVISDGQKTSELVAERPEKPSLLRNPPPRKNAAAAANPVIALAQAPQHQTSPEQAEQINREQQEQMDQLAEALASIDKDVTSGKLDPNAAAEKTTQIMEKYMQEMETKRTRISSEESQNIDRLGADLKARSSEADTPKSPVSDLKPATSAVSENSATKQQAPAQQKPPRSRNPRRRARITRPPDTAAPTPPGKPATSDTPQ